MSSDRQRFEAIFQEHAGAVRAYCLRRAAASDAHDATAEVFAVAWRRRADVPRGRELPWLYGVAARVLSNQRRSASRRSRFVARLAQVPGAPVQGPDGQVESSEADEAVLFALATLARRDREVITLVAWEELSRDEVADALGCSVAAANKRYQRALRQLGRALGADPRGADADRQSSEVADR